MFESVPDRTGGGGVQPPSRTAAKIASVEGSRMVVFVCMMISFVLTRSLSAD
jgi:hypothetical protein